MVKQSKIACHRFWNNHTPLTQHVKFKENVLILRGCSTLEMHNFRLEAFPNYFFLFFTLNQLCGVIVNGNIGRMRCVYQFHNFFNLFTNGNNILSFQLLYELPRLLIQFLSQSFNIWQICWWDDNKCLYRAIFK